MILSGLCGIVVLCGEPGVVKWFYVAKSGEVGKSGKKWLKVDNKKWGK